MQAGSTRGRGNHLVRRWRERDARAALDEFAGSEMSLAEFARSKGVSTQRIWYWQKRLGQTGRTEFVQVELPEPSAGLCERRIEIALDGAVVRVREDVDAEKLASIVEALCRRIRRC